MNMLTIEFRDQTENNVKKDFSFSIILLAALFCTMLFWTPASYGYESNDPLELVNRVTMKFNDVVDTILFKPVANVAHTPTSMILQTGRAVDTRSQLLFFDNMVMGDEYLFVREAYLQIRAEEVGEPGSMEVAFEEF